MLGASQERGPERPFGWASRKQPVFAGEGRQAQDAYERETHHDDDEAGDHVEDQSVLCQQPADRGSGGAERDKDEGEPSTNRSDCLRTRKV